MTAGRAPSAGRILVLGQGARAACAVALLQQAAADVRLEQAPSPEALTRHAATPPALLVLVDPLPFAAGLPEGPIPADFLRSDAMRAVFALELARRIGRTMVLDGDAAGWPGALAAAGLPVDTAAPLPAPLPAPAAVLPDGSDPLQQPYLLPVWRAAAAGRAPPVAWPREAFLDGDVPGETLPALIEVAGRARIVAYGPYLPLPAGTWKATAWLGFSPDIGRLPFILEIDSGGGVARGFFEAERGGIFSLDLDFQVADPLHPLELRLITQDSALEGQAALIEVGLAPG
jgi:hypothetical protein